MISRLTAAAALAILAAASLAFATGTTPAAAPALRADAAPAQVVHLERVVVTAKRLPQQPR